MTLPVRVALFAASPVYYQGPLYRRLAADPRLAFTAIFASDSGARRPFDGEYGRPVEWGVDPLAGYSSVFLRRAASNPPGGSLFDLRDLDLIAHVWRGQYEVLWLHGYHTLSHIFAATTQKMRRGAILYREEQTLLSPRPRWKTLVKDVGLRLLFHNSYGLFLGTANRRWFERWGMPPERLFHVPYAVDNDALQHRAAELAPQREQLRSEFGMAPDAGPVILSVGRLIPKKQPLRLLNAFRAVRSGRRCSLLIVGSGPLEARMRQKVVADGIPDVIFAGFVDQTRIARAYAAADTLALISSHDETWGLVVNEAMNFGLPIVASDCVGAASDLVTHSENGFVVPANDGDALVDALTKIIESAPLRNRMGIASRNRISAWTYDKAAAGARDAIAAAVGAERWRRAA